MLGWFHRNILQYPNFPKKKNTKKNWKNLSFWEGYSNDNVLLNEANKNMIWKSHVLSDVLHKLPDMKLVIHSFPCYDNNLLLTEREGLGGTQDWSRPICNPS